jgi:hypothetical protein
VSRDINVSAGRHPAADRRSDERSEFLRAEIERRSQVALTAGLMG